MSGAVLAPVAVAAVWPAAVTAATAPTGPTSTSPPTVTTASGQAPSVGQTLTATAGTWSGDPTPQVYAYTWWDCAPGGGDGTGCTPSATAGSDATTYTLTAADVGSRVQVEVFTDNGNHASAWSNLTAAVTAAPPATAGGAAGSPIDPAVSTPPGLVGLPLIFGSARPGRTLSAGHGAWSGNPSAYRYAWSACAPGGTCSRIPGANGSRLVVPAALAGRRLAVTVQARNAAGWSRPATSSPTATVPGVTSRRRAVRRPVGYGRRTGGVAV